MKKKRAPAKSGNGKLPPQPVFSKGQRVRNKATGEILVVRAAEPGKVFFEGERRALAPSNFEAV